MAASEILRLTCELARVPGRATTATALARSVGAEDLILLLCDPEIGAYLPAPGFRQTLPSGRVWQEFLSGCEGASLRRGTLPWPSAQETRAVIVVSTEDGVAAVLIGGSPRLDEHEEFQHALPLVGAALRGEMKSLLAASREETAAGSIRNAELLVGTLDEARQELERAFHEIRTLNAGLEERVAERVQEVREMNERLLSFTYTVSHDLRAPIRAMRGYIDALLEDYGDQLGASGQGYVRRVVEATIRMDSLISDLLAYSRLTQVKLGDEPVALRTAVESALELMSRESPEPLPHIAIEIPEPSPVVIAHQSTLVQVIVNLVSNALKFVTRGVEPRITIGVTDGPRPRIWIRDNGVGIASEHHHRIFDIFERLRPEEFPGTGIGLAMVKAAVERMGGKVGVRSEPGEGSEFWVELIGAPREMLQADR